MVSGLIQLHGINTVNTRYSFYMEIMVTMVGHDL